MRKILYLTGTRADYGLMQSVLRAIDSHPNLELEIVATGMHLMKEFGMTINEIKKGGFKIRKLNVTYEEDNKESMASFVGKFIDLLTVEIKKIKPDIILLLGDRGEMLAGAIVGAYLSVPVAHVHGGEITTTVDEVARHAITKLAHLHFTATEMSGQRIIKLGENPKHIHVVGAPGLDTILKMKLIKKADLLKKYNLNGNKPIILLIQHPITLEVDSAPNQMRETLEAIKKLGHQTILIYPNADAGGRKMIKVIKQYEKYPFIKAYKSTPHHDYLSLLNIADVMVGNSSSGIIEAPSFGLPVVNIGARQSGREQAKNILNVPHDKNKIVKAMEKAIFDKGFRNKIKKCKNPYFKKNTGTRIAEILNKIKIDESFLQKKLMY